MKKSPISKRLKETRKRLGLSQAGLGIAAGLDEYSASARMNQYETEKHVPDFGTIQRIAEFAEVPSCYFYCEDDDLALLLVNWKKCPEESRKHCLVIVENKQ